MIYLLCMSEMTKNVLQGLSGFLVVGIILLIVFISKKVKKKPAQFRTKATNIETDADGSKGKKKGKKNKKNKDEEVEEVEEGTTDTDTEEAESQDE